MYIYEVTIPGTWLDYEDKNWSVKTNSILDHLKNQFFEANLSLNMFIQSRISSPARASHSQEQWEADSKRKSDIQKTVEAKYYGSVGHEHWDAIRMETDMLFKREQWQAGRLPREFECTQIFIFARAFLYAIDSFDKFLKTLSNTEGVPEVIGTLHTRLGELFPDLRGVRNSAQHLEDRARGLGAGRNPKPLDLKPVDNNMVSAPNGALILNCLNGSMYGNTMADGHYGEVDISTKSVDGLQEIFQEV